MRVGVRSHRDTTKWSMWPRRCRRAKVRCLLFEERRWQRWWRWSCLIQFTLKLWLKRMLVSNTQARSTTSHPFHVAFAIIAVVSENEKMNVRSIFIHKFITSFWHWKFAIGNDKQARMPRHYRRIDWMSTSHVCWLKLCLSRWNNDDGIMFRCAQFACKNFLAKNDLQGL